MIITIDMLSFKNFSSLIIWVEVSWLDIIVGDKILLILIWFHSLSSQMCLRDIARAGLSDDKVASTPLEFTAKLGCWQISLSYPYLYKHYKCCPCRQPIHICSFHCPLYCSSVHFSISKVISTLVFTSCIPLHLLVDPLVMLIRLMVSVIIAPQLVFVYLGPLFLPSFGSNVSFKIWVLCGIVPLLLIVTSDTTHIEIDCHVTWEHLQMQSVQLHSMSTIEQLAFTLTQATFLLSFSVPWLQTQPGPPNIFNMRFPFLLWMSNSFDSRVYFTFFSIHTCV